MGNTLRTILKKIKPAGVQNKVSIPLYLSIYLLYILIIFSIDLFHFLSYCLPAFPALCIILIILCVLAIIFIIINSVRIETGGFDAADFLAALILILLYFMRMPYPDTNFDTRNYHLFFQSFQFKDIIHYHFFPVSIYSFFYPLSDRMFYIFRTALGYRAGTVLNYLVIVLIYKQVKDILFRYISLRGIKIGNFLLGILSLLTVSTEFIFFNFATYLVDLMFIPLLLEVLKLILFREDGRPQLFYYCAVLSDLPWL